MYNTNKKAFGFLTSKVTFTEYGEDIVQYTNIPSTFYELQNRQGVTDFAVESVIPTEDQIERLDSLNNLPDKEELLGFSWQLEKFVEFGYVDHKLPEAAKPLLEKYKQLSKEYLFKTYKKLLSKYKTEKETGGIMVAGQLIDTSEQSQAKINSTFVSMENGLVKTIKFKTKTGFVDADKGLMRTLAQTVVKHIQDCFGAEAACLDIISHMSYEELNKVSPEWSPEGYGSGFSVNRLHRLFEREYARLAEPTKQPVDNVYEEPKVETYRYADGDSNHKE